MSNSLPNLIINEKDQSAMVLVPSGEFLMGISSEQMELLLNMKEGYKREWFEDESPQHIVFLGSFYIDKYPITNHQYGTFLKETGWHRPKFWHNSKYNHPYQPVVGIDWDDAVAYCRWAGKRLPTEAEWEKAARGTDGRLFPWGNDFDLHKVNASSRIGKPTPVGDHPRGESLYGVQDLAGNVWEWVSDYYIANYYSYSEYDNPKGPDRGDRHSVRGGCWTNEMSFLRCSSRDYRRLPRTSLEFFGFRGVKPVDEELSEPSEPDVSPIYKELRNREDKVVLGDYYRSEMTDLFTSVEPENIPLNILYEDDHIIIINKAPGMLVHPSSRTKKGTLVGALRYHTKDKLSWKGGSDRLGLVHRLDRHTSGVMVIAKTDVAYDSLRSQFDDHSIKKVYNAIVCGIPPQNTAKFNIPISKDLEIFDKSAVRYFFSKESVTHMSILRKFNKYSLLELRLITGRTHQIRLHLSHVGYPVVGDTKYGGKDLSLELASRHRELYNAIRDLRRQALHAKTIGIIHPTKRTYMEFDTPLPEDMTRIINALK